MNAVFNVLGFSVIIMAVNSGQFDLNADAVLFDRENGFNSSSVSNVSGVINVSRSETLINGSLEVLSGPVMVGFHMNPTGCDVMMIGDDSGKEGFGELVKNEDKESVIQCSDVAQYVCGGEEPDKGFGFEFNGGVQIELEFENSRKVAENGGSPRSKVAEAQGVDDSLTECEKEVKNVALVKAADNFVTKDDIEESHASDVATNQLQDGIPFMEDMDVNVNGKESLYMEDFEVDPKHVFPNQTTGINIAEACVSEDTRHGCHGLNLVVDLNSCRNSQESEVNNFCVSDLVWGKVRGHPWWPGQICDPSAASDMAKRHVKENCYLITYFGDQTFAWNDVSTIKPFQMHFSEMEKQSDSEDFQYAVACALEEFSRRVEFGLCCPCMPEEVFSKLKTQVISNAGICKQSSRRSGGDRFLDVASFEPMKLVNFVKSLAQLPLMESDRLDFVIVRAQLSAFYRSKGYSQLPEFTVLNRLFENDMENLLLREKEQCDDQINEQVLKTNLGFPYTSKHISPDRKQPGKKRKLLSDLMSEKNLCIPNGERTSERKAGRKRKASYTTSDDDYFHNSKMRKLTQLQHVSIDEMWSQLCLAAKDPEGENCFSDMIHFFAEFRKSVVPGDSAASLEQEMSLEQSHGGDTGVNSIEAVTSMPTAKEPCNDPYWTDRVIQSISEEQSLLKNQNRREEFLPEIPAAEISTNLGLMQQETDRNLVSEPSEEGFCPTSLTLKFTNLDSVPSTTDLNRIFGRFGPLMESKTELLMRSNRARVVFRRRSDAETAFSSAGKYSIFGPSLVSYRLNILPSRLLTKGTGKRGRKSKKETCSVVGAAV